MVKVAYNACYGGFSLSRAAVLRARELSGNPRWGGAYIKGDKFEDSDKICDFDYGHLDYEFPRHDPILVQVIEELGEKANGMCAQLAIHILQDGESYRIDEYDGIESVMTRTDYEWITP